MDPIVQCIDTFVLALVPSSATSIHPYSQRRPQRYQQELAADQEGDQQRA